MFVAEHFLRSSLVKKCGNTPFLLMVGSGTWYTSQACKFLQIKHHHLYSSYEGGIIERRIQYIKDRTEGFDDYFPCRKEKCRLELLSTGSIFL
jgi:putative transposase